MAARDAGDAALIEDCAELADFLASYEAGCQLVAAAEGAQAGEPDIEQARARLLTTGRLWRASLHRVARRRAHTVVGLVAKARALQSTLVLWSPEPSETTEFTASVVADMLRLLSDGPEPRP